MTRLTRARLILAVVCILFFLLGTGTMAVVPLTPLADWFAGKRIKPDLKYDVLLHLSGEQVEKRDALYREWNARLKQIKDEIKKVYYPKIQKVNREIQDRLFNEILDDEQRVLFDEYSTGKRKLPQSGE